MVEDYKRNVVDYFKKNLAKGYTIDTLRYALIAQGYSRTIVDSSLQKAQMELAEKAPVLIDTPKIIYEVVDENDRPIQLKKPWWKRIFGL